MSQSTVEIQQGHRTNATESREGAEELATAYSSSILDGRLSLIILEIIFSYQRNVDRPMSLTALDALDQMATNYIEYSKLLKSATPAPPQHAGRYMSSVHSSALPYVGSFTGLRPRKQLLMRACKRCKVNGMVRGCSSTVLTDSHRPRK